MNAKEIIETNDFGVTWDGIKIPYPDPTSSLQIGKNIGYVMGVRAERAKGKGAAEDRYHKAANELEENIKFWAMVNPPMWKKILTALRFTAFGKEGEG